MSDNSLIPMTDAQAEMVGQAIGGVREAGRYIADVLGDLPKDLVGMLLGDALKARRAERLARIWHKAQQKLEADGVTAPEPPSLKIALPILAAAADEGREELQEIWARLLAASMNPNKSLMVRLKFAEALRQLDPLDARLMMAIQQKGGAFDNTKRNEIVSEMRITQDEFFVSFSNLTASGFCADYNGITSGLTPLGREFLRSVVD